MQSLYYNGSDALNALHHDCWLAFSVGNRSTGKSYYWKRQCMLEFVRNKRRFIYTRRQVQELEKASNEFFSDIGQDKALKGYSFECMKVKTLITYFLLKIDPQTNEEIYREVCGYGIALPNLVSAKSIPLETVDTIFFDEFMADDYSFLRPLDPSYEPGLLLSLYLTVARGHNQVIREEVKVICVANMVSYFNPYFTIYELNISNTNKMKKDGVYVENIHNEAVANIIKNSKVGKALMKTSYGQYAINNKPLIDFSGHIGKHGKNSKCLFNIHCFKWYSAWWDLDQHRMFFSDSYDRTFPRAYKVTDNFTDPYDKDREIKWFRGDIVKVLKAQFEADKIYYESEAIKSVLAGLIIPKSIVK